MINFCWWCNAELARVNGQDGSSTPVSAIVRDPDDNELHVHKTCEPDALNFFKVFTAIPPEAMNPAFPTVDNEDDHGNH